MAEKTEFLQAIDDAILDADSLEKFVNGPDSETVLTRLSARYPTIKKMIAKIESDFKKLGADATTDYQALFEQLLKENSIAGRFKTLTALQASSLTDGSYALVADDTEDKNGLYIKEGGVWGKSKYTVISESKLSSLVSHSPSDNILSVLDKNDNDVLRVGLNGEVSLLGLDDTVQDSINDFKSYINANDFKAYISVSDLSPLLEIKDSNGSNVARFEADGSLYLLNLNESVQDSINNLGKAVQDGINNNNNNGKDPIIPDVKQPQHEYSKSRAHHDKVYSVPSSVKDKLYVAKVFDENTCPIPLYFAPQDFTLSTEAIASVRTINDVGTDNDVIQIAGYDPMFREDIGVVHPQVWEFTEKVAGYRYWLGINPYTNGNENVELPFIYGSNDPALKEWELIPSFPQPFEADPVDEGGSYRGFMSDSAFTYDVDTGDLIFFWRKYLYFKNEGSADTEKVAVRASRFDGKAWSDIFDLVPMQVINSLGSTYRTMSIIYNPTDKLYYCYVGHARSGEIRYHTTEKLDGRPWSMAKTCTYIAAWKNIWHFEIKVIGDKVVFLGQVQGSSANSGLYLGTIENGDSIRLNPDRLHSNDFALYKASLLPHIDKNGKGFLNIFYTDTSVKRFYVTKTTTFNIEEI